jgi:uncharacterized membrane protein
MSADNATKGFGSRVYGLGLMALGAVNLMWGDFDSGQPVPDDFPHRMALAYCAAAFLLLAGLAMQWRRTAPKAGAALAIYYALVVVILINGPGVIANYREFGSYSWTAEELAVAVGGLIVYASFATIDVALATRLTRVGQLTFGVCAVLFGGAHFAYLNLTVPLIPKWLPPSREFWAYATGVFHIAGGLAILAGIRARLAAILLTVMYASWTPLVHLPTVLAAPDVFFNWTENALNLVLTGVAWIVADSLRARRA